MGAKQPDMSKTTDMSKLPSAPVGSVGEDKFMHQLISDVYHITNESSKANT